MSGTLARLGLPDPGKPAKPEGQSTLSTLGLPEPFENPFPQTSEGRKLDRFSPEAIADRDKPIVDEGVGPLAWLPLARAGTAGYKAGEAAAKGAGSWLLRKAAAGAASGAAGGAVEAASREANPAGYVAAGAAGGALLGPAVEAAIPAAGSLLGRMRGSPASASPKPHVSPVEPVETLPPAKVPPAVETPPAAAVRAPATPETATPENPVPFSAKESGADRLYHETDPETAFTLATGRGLHRRGLMVSPSEELALGQSGQGAVVEFGNTHAIAARESNAKPMAAAVRAATGKPAEMEILAAPYEGESFTRSVTLKPGAQLPPYAERYFTNNGWTREVLPDGSVRWNNPRMAAPAPATAEPRPVGTPGTGPVTAKNAQQFPALGDFAEAVRNDPATLERLKKLGGGRAVSNEETLRRALEIGPMHPDEVASWPAEAPMDHVTQTRILLTFDHFQQARNAAHMAGDLAAEAAAQREVARLIPGVYNARAMGGRITQAQAMFVQDEMSKILDSLADMEAKGVPLEQARARANELLAQSEAAAKVAGAAKEWREALGGLETASTWVKLTAPVTHMVNFASNALTFGVVRPLEQAGRAATYLAQGNSPAAAAETQALFGTRTGLLSGMKRWAAAVMDDAETGALASEYGDRQIKLPKALRPFDVFRQLSGADAFWKGILEDSRLYQLAYRSAREAGLTGKALAARVSELRANPPQSWADEAASYAKEYTFQMDADAFLKKIQGIGNLPGMKFVLPFTKTPYNLQKFFMQRSPYGLASGRNLAGLKAGGQAQAEAVGRLAAGVGLSAGALALVSSTDATGAYPSNPRERERWKAQGIKEYSLRVPGTRLWVQYNRFAPLGQYIGQAVALRDALERGEQNRVSALASGMLAATMKQTLDLPFMQSLSDLLDAVTGAAEPEGTEKKAPERFAQGVVTGLVPNVLRDVRQQTDETVRRPSGAVQAVQNMIPGQSQNLPAAVDVFGRTISYEKNRLTRASKVLSTRHAAPEDQLLERLGWSPSMPEPQVAVRGEKKPRKIEGAELERFQREMGAATLKAVRGFVGNKAFDALDRDAQVDRLNDAVNKARRGVRERWKSQLVKVPNLTR